MVPRNNNWQIDVPLTLEAEKALVEFPPLFRQILYNRGYSTLDAAQKYLEAVPPQETDPFGILDLPDAVNRIERAIKHNEHIAIYGDYDADGVSATALLVQVLKWLNAQVEGYIPNRFNEGYGLNIEALEYLRSKGVKLVITVDCGIRSLAEAEYARNIGLDLIISDHHHPGREIPQAIAVINPKRQGDPYPEKNLAGVGLAFKLAQALLHNRKVNIPTKSKDIELNSFYDLVAIGTVADLVPLIGENRSLVRAGLNEMQSPKRQGLLSLLMISGLNAKKLTASDISFILGPRLNAAGRLDTALTAYKLLITENLHEAGLLAQELDAQNQERQKLTRSAQALAEQITQADNLDNLLLFAVHPDFNPGVVGLAASRLADLYYRPAIVAHQGESFTRGSCRSISEFHITEALDQCADLFEHHGGHAAAAGFTIRNENLSNLRARLQKIAEEKLGSKDLTPTLFADAEIYLSELKPELLEFLDKIQPTGYGNREAVFVSRQLHVNYHKIVGKNNAHLKLSVSDGRITYDAIAFNQGYWQDQLPQEVDILYTFEMNEWNGRMNLQLNIKDMKPSHPPN
ncbi:MAG: single-stranded-DNA-specific exonuclease RecJ [Anaerolineales bacterium]|nr:single-stranded-DNA-specific exonuclease RecJ [Anaerolineales bacterium]